MKIQIKNQRGVTLVEIAISIVLLSVLITVLFNALGNAIGSIQYIKNEKFSQHMQKTVLEYYKQNVSDPAVNPRTSQFMVGAGNPAPVHIPAAAINPFSSGVVTDVAIDFNNNRWWYVNCSFNNPNNVIAVGEQNWRFCDIVAYRNENQLPVADLVMTNIAFWNNRLNANVIDDYIIISGSNVVHEAVSQTRKSVKRVRDLLENYYVLLVSHTEEQPYFINRFAGHDGFNKQSQTSYDVRSALNSDNVLDNNELSAIGLVPNDLITPFGSIQIDNTNNNRFPYTAQVFVNFQDVNADTLKISTLAVSKL